MKWEVGCGENKAAFCLLYSDDRILTAESYINPGCDEFGYSTILDVSTGQPLSSRGVLKYL